MIRQVELRELVKMQNERDRLSREHSAAKKIVEALEAEMLVRVKAKEAIEAGMRCVGMVTERVFAMPYKRICLLVMSEVTLQRHVDEIGWKDKEVLTVSEVPGVIKTKQASK